MTSENMARQGFLPGVVKDRAKSVSVPRHRSHAVELAGKGISVGRDWRIIADEMNVTAYRRVQTKAGGERWEAHGYYSTIANALIGLVHQGIRDTELASVRAVEEKIDQLRADIFKMAATK